MAKVISKLTVLVGAATSGFSGDLKRAGKVVQDFGARIETSLRTSVAGFARFVAGGAAAAATVASLRAEFANIDSLAKTADKLGETTEALAAFRFAAEQTGVGADQASVGLQRMVRRISAAAQGTGEAVGALQELGLSAQRLNTLAPTQAFAEIADAMGRVESQSDRVRLTFKLFDSEGVNLVNTMRLGSQGLADMQAQAERLGIALSRDAAAEVEAANDAMHRMQTAAQGLTRVLATNLAPAVVVISDAISNVIMAVGNLDAKVVANIATVAAFAAGFVALLKVVPLVIRGIRSVILMMRAFTTASIVAQAVANPLALVKIGVALAGAAVIATGVAYQFNRYAEAAENAAAGSEKLVKQAQRIKPEVAKPVQETADAMARVREETEKWQRIGERLTERFQTPFQRMQSSVAEAQEALRRGVITWQVYQRAVESAADQFERATEVGDRLRRQNSSVAAVQRGTSSAFSAIGRGRDQLRLMADQLKQQNQKAEARRKLLEQLNSGVRDVEDAVRNGGIEVREVRI